MAIKKTSTKKATAKKATAKPSAMRESAKSHQRDLARTAGTVAVINEEKRQNAALVAGKGIKSWNGNKIVAAGPKATKKTLASFKKSK
jgi:hypothetical protein